MMKKYLWMFITIGILINTVVLGQFNFTVVDNETATPTETVVYSPSLKFTPGVLGNYYTKIEIDETLGNLTADLAQGNRIYYCTPETTLIGAATYGVLLQELPPEVSSVTIGPIVGTTFAQYDPGRGRITEALGVTSIPAGVYNRVSHMSNSDINGRNVELVYELWHVDAAGTKIALVATSSPKLILGVSGNTIQRVDNEYTVVAPVAVDPTDRLMEDFYFRRTGVTSGTNPTITRYIGGNRAGFLNMSLPSGVVMLKDGSNATHLDTWTTTVNGGDTLLSTPTKFTKGLLYVGGLVYDLADTTQVTLDNTGATTVISFVSPIVGTHTATLLRLR